jgi:hypothetical protein
MKSSVLFAMFLVGAVSTATAQPKQEETSGRVSLNEQAPADQPPRSPDDWVELATPTPAKHGTEYVVVGKEQGGFARLRLDAVKGAVPVKSVRVELSDGTTKTYRVNKRIDAKRHKSLFVDLPATVEIDHVVVTTARRSAGEYAVYGSVEGQKTSGGGVVAGR